MTKIHWIVFLNFFFSNINRSIIIGVVTNKNKARNVKITCNYLFVIWTMNLEPLCENPAKSFVSMCIYRAELPVYSWDKSDNLHPCHPPAQKPATSPDSKDTHWFLVFSWHLLTLRRKHGMKALLLHNGILETASVDMVRRKGHRCSPPSLWMAAVQQGCSRPVINQIK